MIQGESAARAHVENLARNVWRFTREQIGLDSVLDIREIASLLAVTEDHRLRLFQESGAEFCKYARIGRAGILPGPENIEVAERNVFEAVHAAKRLRIQLADVLRDAVGRNGFRLHGFDFWQRGRLAIGRRRSREDQALDLGVACRDEDVECAVDIDAIGFDGVFHRPRHGGTRRKMQDAFSFVNGFAHHLEVRDTPFDERNLVAGFR